MKVLARYVDNGKWGYVRVRLDDGRVVPEHRFVIEQQLGRKLARAEHVHHRDGDKHNNHLGNLELITASSHAKTHARSAETITLTCPECRRSFTTSARQVRSRKKNGALRAFCSRQCSGAYNGRRRNKP